MTRPSLAATLIPSFAVVVVTFIAPATAAAAEPVITANCRITFASPRFIPISGTPQEVLIDPKCQHVYITNTSVNRVEVVSLQTGRLAAPISVGSAPMGLDITPDGSKLYVATSGANMVSVVDTVKGIEARRIPVPPNSFSNDTPFSIAIANNGLAFLSTTFAGSGFGARMLQLDLATDAVTQRTDFYSGGTTTEVTILRASPEKNWIGIVAGDISSGPVFSLPTCCSIGKDDGALTLDHGQAQVSNGP
jgi:YVTN family beta-propeller protein